MKKEQKYNIKNSIFSLSMILSVIGMRIMDQYVYDMNIWAGTMIVILLVMILYKIIDSIAELDKEITKKTRLVLNISTLALIFVLFYTFTL